MKTENKILTVSLIAVSLFGAASAQSVDVEPGYVNPQEVEPNTTVSNQEFNTVVNNLSADGDTDEIYFEFPHFLNESLSPNNVDSNISISSSKTMVDSDNDGTVESVKVGISRDGEGSVTGNITLDIGITYPAEFDSFPVEATVNDSSNGDSTTTLNVNNAGTTQEETSDSEESDSTENSTEDSESTDEEDGEDSSDSGDNEETEEDTNDSDSTEDETSDQEEAESDSDSGETDEQQNEDETTDNSDEETSDEESSSTDENRGEESSETTDAGIVEALISFFEGIF